VSTIAVIGALLFLAGIVWMARAAILRGRMSDPRRNPDDPAGTSLEPRQRGLGFLGLGANLPGLVLVVLGAVVLLWPLLF
jgi:hypothetical protein